MHGFFFFLNTENS